MKHPDVDSSKGRVPRDPRGAGGPPRHLVSGTVSYSRVVCILAVAAAMPLAGFAQSEEPLTVTGKLKFHAESSISPLAIAGVAAYAAVLQEADAPLELR